MFSDLERLIARADFRENKQVNKIREQLDSIETMMQGHAAHEDNKLHSLLRQKGSVVHHAIEKEHQHHEAQYGEFKRMLKQIIDTPPEEEKLRLGYEFFLSYRLFFSENLQHFHTEETIIMSELQRLYTDEELRRVEFDTYAMMTPEQMAHMMEVLSPYMDPNDRTFFLREMKESEPEKFVKAWQLMTPKLTEVI
jgi:hypothetical protein